MSDRLAISATFSVLMMALYVLFGAEAVRTTFPEPGLKTPASLVAPIPVSRSILAD